MKIAISKRQQVKMKLSIAGPAGSGKTYSALLLAFGLTNDWKKVCLVDTENRSASLYSHLGAFNVIDMQPPYTPEKFVQAIQMSEEAGMEVIILDSGSAEWNGKGGCLDLHEKETSKMRIPNSFTAWAAIIPRHQRFIDAILQSNCHVISCLRSKTEYVLTERNGKQVPQKVGMAPETRSGFEYEVSIAFELDQQHKAFCSKDRTHLFQDKGSIIITPETGKTILDWCSYGEINEHSEQGEQNEYKFFITRIDSCNSIAELGRLYILCPEKQQTHISQFSKRKQELLLKEQQKQLLQTQNYSHNGNGSV